MWIHFEDHGQDFLWFDLSEEGRVLDVGPHQSWVWKDTTGKIIREGKKRWFEFEDKYGVSRVIACPITRIQKVLASNLKSA